MNEAVGYTNSMQMVKNEREGGRRRERRARARCSGVKSKVLGTRETKGEGETETATSPGGPDYDKAWARPRSPFARSFINSTLTKSLSPSLLLTRSQARERERINTRALARYTSPLYAY